MTGPIRRVADPAELDEFFCDRPAAHIYARVDLEDPYWSASRWYRREDAVVGFVALAGTEHPTVYAVSTRDSSATLDLLIELGDEIEPGMLLTGPVGLGDALAAIGPVAWSERHVRYVLTDRSRLPPLAACVENLGEEHLEQVLALYEQEPGAAFFLPSMLGDDSFVGTRDGGRLVAIAGTHVLSSHKRIAAIGGVFTTPSHRGQGLGRAVSVGVLRRIAGRVDEIGLNTAAGKAAARSIYESIGFEPILDYEEAELASGSA